MENPPETPKPTAPPAETTEAVSPSDTRIGIEEFQKVVRFVRLCAGYYLPFVELTRPVLEGVSILVRHGVDVYQHDTDLSLWERMRFVFLGKIRFEFGIPFYAFETPPFSTTMSYHLRIRTPSGLRITDRPIPLTERMFKEVKLEGFLNYESDNVYVYLTGTP